MDDLKERVMANAAAILAERPESQRELARRAGVKIGRLERCLDRRRTSMSSKSIALLADILGVDLHDLTVPIDPKKPRK